MHVVALVLCPAIHVCTQVDHVCRLSRGIVKVNSSAKVVLRRTAVASTGDLIHLGIQ